jgi:hypothetical protein
MKRGFTHYILTKVGFPCHGGTHRSTSCRTIAAPGPSSIRGQRSAAWQKIRVLQRRDFVIGGYTPAGRTFDAILIGDLEGRAL